MGARTGEKRPNSGDVTLTSRELLPVVRREVQPRSHPHESAPKSLPPEPPTGLPTGSELGRGDEARVHPPSVAEPSPARAAETADGGEQRQRRDCGDEVSRSTS